MVLEGGPRRITLKVLSLYTKLPPCIMLSTLNTFVLHFLTYFFNSTILKTSLQATLVFRNQLRKEEGWWEEEKKENG